MSKAVTNSIKGPLTVHPGGMYDDRNFSAHARRFRSQKNLRRIVVAETAADLFCDEVEQAPIYVNVGGTTLHARGLGRKCFETEDGLRTSVGRACAG